MPRKSNWRELLIIGIAVFIAIFIGYLIACGILWNVDQLLGRNHGGF